MAPGPLEDRRSPGTAATSAAARPSEPTDRASEDSGRSSRALRRQRATARGRRPAQGRAQRARASALPGPELPRRRRIAARRCCFLELLRGWRTGHGREQEEREARRRGTGRRSLATFRMSGIGIGMMSPRDRVAPGSRASAAWRARSWSGRAELVPAGSPQRSMLGSQTGMKPPLATMATALHRIPTNASGMPGCSRLTHSPTSSSANAAPNSGRRRLSARSLPPIDRELGRVAQPPPPGKELDRRSRTRPRFTMRPPASRPEDEPERDADDQHPCISGVLRCTRPAVAGRHLRPVVGVTGRRGPRRSVMLGRGSVALVRHPLAAWRDQRDRPQLRLGPRRRRRRPRRS